MSDFKMSGRLQKSVIIVGGGPVGCVNAIFLAKRGYDVHIYELREDIRKCKKIYGRSINLTLATRGLEALKRAGIPETITDNGIPLYGRVVHNNTGHCRQMLYGRRDQHITSVDRCQVNRILMTAAEKTPNVHIHFDHKLQCCDLDEGKANFITSTGDKVECRADLIVGCDGAHSQLRCQIMKKIPMNFRQEYLPHQYMELRMTPKTKKFDINGSNYLHVWPRTKFMLLSMPDFEEQCYVSILTMPEDMFKGITKAKQLTDFFRKHFPDFLEFIGVEEKDLVDTFFSWGPVPLISVKCEPYHYQDKAVFMGDAAHAMYPFYGQGMNCGFEDCQRFNELLDKHHDDLSKVLEEFSATRKPDVDAMIDLSERQYNLLMDTVTSKRFTMRKYIDNILHWVMPNSWIPLYTAVAFTTIPYKQCMESRQRQDKIIKKAFFWSAAGLFAGTVLTTCRYLSFSEGS